MVKRVYHAIARITWEVEVAVITEIVAGFPFDTMDAISVMEENLNIKENQGSMVSYRIYIFHNKKLIFLKIFI